jgi:SAM-dependent methyltransferase
MYHISFRPYWLLIFVLSILVLTSFACTKEYDEVALVGERTITTEDLAYRQAVLEIRSGKGFPAHLALLQLIEEALMAEVGRAYGIEVSPAMLTEEAKRVQQTSRDPETLKLIQAVFEGDENAYKRLMLEPILVNQLLNARFSLGHDIQSEPLARAKQVLAAAQLDPTSMPGLAEVYGGEYRQLQIIAGKLTSGEIPNEDNIIPELAQYGLEFPDYDQQFVDQVASVLKPGEFHPKVVEDRSNFMVVRSISRNGEDALLESIVIAKLAFDPWFQTQSQRVNLVIFEQVLKKELLSDVEVPYITSRLSDHE